MALLWGPYTGFAHPWKKREVNKELQKFINLLISPLVITPPNILSNFKQNQ